MICHTHHKVERDGNGAEGEGGKCGVEDVPRRVLGVTQARGVQGRGAAPRYRLFIFITQAFTIIKLCSTQGV